MKNLDNQTLKEDNSNKNRDDGFVMLDDYFIPGDCVNYADSEAAWQRYKAGKKKET